MPIPVVCEPERNSVAAAAGGDDDDDSPVSACSMSDQRPVQLDVNVNVHGCCSDVIASTDVTAPEQLRHRSSWPEDALAEHLMDMRSC